MFAQVDRKNRGFLPSDGTYQKLRKLAAISGWRSRELVRADPAPSLAMERFTNEAPLRCDGGREALVVDGREA